MRLRFIVVLIGLVFSLLMLSSVHATTNRGGYDVFHARADNQGVYKTKRFSGTVWVDENVDGIRQPSESGAAGSFLSFGRPIRPHYNGSYYVKVLYFEPGAKPVKRQGNAFYTHENCTFVRPLPGDGNLTVDIRVVQSGQHHLSPRNWPLVEGQFFAEAAYLDVNCDAGFSVTNTDGIPFWDTWQHLDLENVGYPISHRFYWKGLITQAFQKMVFQWQPGKGVFFLNILDELHDAGLDEELRFRFYTPRQLDPSFDYTYPVDDQDWVGPEVWAEIVRRRLTLLDANPAIKEKYYSAPDPLLQYGLPTSRVKDHGNKLVIRTQRAVFQQWKQDVPWAKAGEVTIANGGDIAKELGLFPEHALIPHPAGFVGARPP